MFVMYLIDFIHPIAGELKDKLAGLDRSGHGVVVRERVGHRLTGRGFLPLHALPGRFAPHHTPRHRKHSEAGTLLR